MRAAWMWARADIGRRWASLLLLAVLVAFCAFVLPRVGRWAFTYVGESHTTRFLFLLAALTSAALVADRMGLEGIVGAFFAGLALNRLVPHEGGLKERVEFVGGTILIPFFLLSTGMLLDPRQFTEGDVLVIAGASLAVVVVGKAAASYLAGRLAGVLPDRDHSSALDAAEDRCKGHRSTRSSCRPGTGTR